MGYGDIALSSEKQSCIFLMSPPTSSLPSGLGSSRNSSTSCSHLQTCVTTFLAAQLPPLSLSGVQLSLSLLSPSGETQLFRQLCHLLLQLLHHLESDKLYSHYISSDDNSPVWGPALRLLSLRSLSLPPAERTDMSILSPEKINVIAEMYR